MMKKISLRTLFALLVFSSMLTAGTVHAGYMGFTVESLQTDDSDGC